MQIPLTVKVLSVEKVLLKVLTPKSPNWYLLISRKLESPPWGVWGWRLAFSTVPVFAAKKRLFDTL
jgi:hypothetical protein